MVFMCVLVVESLCQTTTGRISPLDCLLLDARGSLWLRLILYGIKWPRCPRTSALGPLARYWRPPSMVTGSQARAEPGHKDELDWANKW
jgi:hypothetical protein